MSDVTVSIGGKLEASFNSMFAKAGSYMNSFKNSINSQLLSTLGAAQLASKAIGSITSSMSQLSSNSKMFTNLGAQFGMKPEEVAKLNKVANESGVSQRNLIKGFQTLKMKAIEALSDPASDAGKYFARLGISVEQLKEGVKDVNAVSFFGQWSDKINQIGDDAQNTSAIVDGLGANGMRMSSMIEMGSEEQKKALDGAFTANDIQIGQAKSLHDWWEKIKDMLSWCVDWMVVLLNQTVGWGTLLVAKVGVAITDLMLKYEGIAKIARFLANGTPITKGLFAVGESMLGGVEKANEKFKDLIAQANAMIKAGFNVKKPENPSQRDYTSTSTQKEIDSALKALQDAKNKGATIGVAEQEALLELKKEEVALQKDLLDLSTKIKGQGKDPLKNVDYINKQTELQNKQNEIKTSEKKITDDLKASEDALHKAKTTNLEKLLEGEDLLIQYKKEADELESKRDAEKDPKKKIDIETQRIEKITQIQELEKKIIDDKVKAMNTLHADEIKRAKELADAKKTNQTKEQDLADNIADRVMKNSGATDAQISQAKLDREMVRLDQMKSTYNQYMNESKQKELSIQKEIDEAKKSNNYELQNQKEQQLSDLLKEEQTKRGELLDEASKAQSMIPDKSKPTIQSFASHMAQIGGGGGFVQFLNKKPELDVAKKSEQHLQAIRNAVEGGGLDTGGTTNNTLKHFSIWGGTTTKQEGLGWNRP